MQCLRAKLGEGETRRPSERDLRLGENWSCQKLTLARAPETSGVSTDYVVTDPTQNAIAYRFVKRGRAFDNVEGTAHRNRARKVDYLTYQERGLDALLGLPFGIRRGFFWDFLRITARGELISEESVFDLDVPNFPMGTDTPDALGGERQKVYSYSVCRTESGWRNPAAPVCF